MTINQPHSRDPHLYVVIRLDLWAGLEPPFSEEQLTVTSVFESEEAADAEAERLNGLAAGRGVSSRYIVRIGRLRS